MRTRPIPLLAHSTIAGALGAALLVGCGGDEQAQQTGDAARRWTGAIRVSVTTTGSDLDADGYAVQLDGGAAVPIAIGGAVTFSPVAVGTHSVALGGIAANCTAAGANPQTVSVTRSATSNVAWSVSCAAVPRVPDAPAGTSARPVTSTAVEVTWTDRSTNEDGFRIERSTDGGTSYAALASVGSGAASYVDAQAVTNYLVCYRVAAYNALGASAPSAADCTTPQGAPKNLTAAKVDAHSIDLWWTSTAWTPDGFEIQRAGAETGPWVAIAQIAPASTFRDASLASTAGTWWYRVFATRDSGYSDPSNAALAVEPTAPAAPGPVHATPYWGIAADVAWYDNSTNEDGFRLERSMDGRLTWTVLGTTGPNVSSRFDNGDSGWLVPEQEVCYRVIAFNSSGDSSPAGTCTVPPAAPATIDAVAVDFQSILVTWSDSSSYEDSYEIQRMDFGYSMGMWGPLATVPADTTSFVDPWVEPEMEYFYRVAAVKNGGINLSGEVSAITPPAPAVATAR